MNNLDLLEVYHCDKKKRLGINCDGGYVIGDIDTWYMTVIFPQEYLVKKVFQEISLQNTI